ncbi:hypothetical protein JCM12298_03970 [Desulfothermus naphthae]
MEEILERRVTDLEMMMARVLLAQQDTQISIKRLSEEMREFKDEMRAFKDEMTAFKDEMCAFKDEMKVFKDGMTFFKDEMKVFKDEMRKEVKQINKQWGALSNKLGTVVEDLISPAIPSVLKKYFNCDPEEVSIRVKKKKGNMRDEFDAVAVCEKSVFLFEVKATPRPEYVIEFHEKKAKRFRELFNEHKDKKLVLIFGSIRLEEDILNLLTKKGIYGMAYRDWEYMDILNFDQIPFNGN